MNIRGKEKTIIAYIGSAERLEIKEELARCSKEILNLNKAPDSVDDWLASPDLIVLDDNYLDDWEKEWEKIIGIDVFKELPFILITSSFLNKKSLLKLLNRGLFGVVNNHQLDQLSILCTSAIIQGKKVKKEQLKANELNRILSTNYLIIDAKNKQLEETKSKLEKLINLQEEVSAKHLKYLISEIDQKLNKEYHYQLFKVHFEEVHPLFYKKLFMINYKLTDNNLKLLAFLKMGFNNNEISFLLNISLAAVKKSIQRLKLKLDLSPKDSLRAFLFNI